MKSEVMYEGIVQLDEFTLPEVPASVQEAGDKAFAESAKRLVNAAGEPYVWVGVGKKRADAGKPRPKPQPAPGSEQKAGGITKEQAQELKDWITLVQAKTSEDCEARRALETAYSNACYFIDSLAK